MELRKFNVWHGNEMEYFFLKRHELDGILSQSGETYEPRGLFVCRDRIGDGVTVYTAVRNLDGSGETEEFRNLSGAVRWLHGLTFYERSLYRPGACADPYMEELADLVEGEQC